jgi:hypothetical protein
MVPTKATGTTLGTALRLAAFWSWLTERRRSRTDRAWGCHAAPVLKVCYLSLG